MSTNPIFRDVEFHPDVDPTKLTPDTAPATVSPFVTMHVRQSWNHNSNKNKNQWQKPSQQQPQPQPQPSQQSLFSHDTTSTDGFSMMKQDFSYQDEYEYNDNNSSLPDLNPMSSSDANHHTKGVDSSEEEANDDDEGNTNNEDYSTAVSNVHAGIMEEDGNSPSVPPEMNDVSAMTLSSHFATQNPHATETNEYCEQETLLIQQKSSLIKRLLIWTVGLVIASLIAVSVGLSKTKIPSPTDTDNINNEPLNMEEPTRLRQQENPTTQVATSALSEPDVKNKQFQDASLEYEQQLQKSLSNFAKAIIDNNNDNNTIWPFVTLDDSERLGQPLRSRTGLDFVAFSPLVTANLRQAWEFYAWEHQMWVEDSWNYYVDDNSSEPPYDNHPGPIAPEIYHPEQNGYDVSDEPFDSDSGTYGPLWQTSPPPSQAIYINRDMLSYPLIRSLFREATSNDNKNHNNNHDSMAVVSPIVTDLPEMYGFEDDLMDEFGNTDNQHGPDAPRSLMLLPVYDKTFANTNDTVVGFLQAILPWDTYLKAFILTTIEQNVTGMAYIRNNCGQTISYRISNKGSSKNETILVEYINDDNMTQSLNNPQQQQQQQVYLLDDIFAPFAKNGNGVESCSYSMEFHIDEKIPDTVVIGDETDNNEHLVDPMPDEILEAENEEGGAVDQENFITQAPTSSPPSSATISPSSNKIISSIFDDLRTVENSLIAALVMMVLSTLLLCWAVFVFSQMMDLIHRRHEDLLRSAAKSSAIVTNMFPGNFKDRVIAEHSCHDETNHGEDNNSKSKNNMDESAKRFEVEDGNESKVPRKPIRRITMDMLRSSANSNHSNRSNAIKSFQSNHDSADQLQLSDKSDNTGFTDTSAARQRNRPQRGASLQRAASIRIKGFLDNGIIGADPINSAPIADLFPHCTVMYADISGFTAWSSVREPSQVFTLLETLYKAFDMIALRRKVFKVETVGDSYVCVTGLPEPQDDHALIMVRFAKECLYKSYELTKKLEVTLGPDTGDLSMRFGMHSGNVTAGVLRGDRARFQLFGDTVNTARFIESTGQKGRIQLSAETADALTLLGKSHLLRQREDTVIIKGAPAKTFWVALGAATEDETGGDDVPVPPSLFRNVSTSVESIVEEEENESGTDDENDLPGEKKRSKPQPTRSGRRPPPTSSFQRKLPAVSMSGMAGRMGMDFSIREMQGKESRLIEWNVEVLCKMLKHVIARRKALGLQPSPEEPRLHRPEGQTFLEEVQEIITLPSFVEVENQENVEKMVLDGRVKRQLHDYVTALASMYRDNHFHNYEHASHVTMSVVKLLSRIVAPKKMEWKTMTTAQKMASELHDHTYGITSDPLTQFAVVLSALIHDVDHSGVPNTQLVKENTEVAERYKNQSVAEQNSLDIAWNLLMEPHYRELRKAIYCNETELVRFRSLLVNSVMATDIVDKELKQLRNDRWDKAFSTDEPMTQEDVHTVVNRKATIVIEHIIQASDVSHTMQHWHVYRKWNERFFNELYSAYRAGRAEKDPSEFWYKGEIGFFDFYIIPLAKKLKDCGVFGVSSDEYLNYAIKNREEWAKKGELVTAEMVAKAKDKYFARMEKQATVRAPLISEMKLAVKEARTPQPTNSGRFRQKSFRHLSVEPEVAESVAGTDALSRPVAVGGVPRTSSTGSREAMRNFRRVQPSNSGQQLPSAGRRSTSRPVMKPPQRMPSGDLPDPLQMSPRRGGPATPRMPMKRPTRKSSTRDLDASD